MANIVTFGEVMLRLKSPGFERLLQSPILEATFGGAEANVAASLAQFGVDARFVSAIPADNVGDSSVGTLVVRRRYRRCSTSGGAARDLLPRDWGDATPDPRHLRSRRFVDRDRRPSDIDLDAIFAGADWFHVTGVTPAISAWAAALSIEAVAAPGRRESPCRATTTIARISGSMARRRPKSCASSSRSPRSASQTKRIARRRSASAPRWTSRRAGSTSRPSRG